jgi:hypothetical protein
MINLLPPELKSSYRYARLNVKLRTWVLLFLVALIGLGALATYGLLSLGQSTAHYRSEIAHAEAAFKKEQFTATQKRVKEISSNFKLVVQVLQREVLFSQLLKQMGTIIPANTNLVGLNIGQDQSGIDISATAADYKAATQLQINLADPNNKIFAKADIISISCESTSATTATATAYPCKVTIRALLAPNNPFLFINSKGVKS